jgi:hypothetical protein
MAKKKVESVTEKQDDIVNLSTLGYHGLMDLANRARTLANEKSQEEKDKSKKELLKNEKVQALKTKLKELDKEYKSLLKGTDPTVTLMVPIKFTLGLSGQDDTLIGAISQYSYHGDVQAEDLFATELSGQVVYKDSNLDKIQKGYIEQAVEDFTYDACAESMNLFPEARKNLKAFAQKVRKAMDADILAEMNKAGLTIADLR